MKFHDVTLAATGTRRSARLHDSAALLPAAVEVFRTLLEKHGRAFREPIPFAGLERISLQWTQEDACPGVAFASFFSGDQLVTFSVLLGGEDAAAEAHAVRSAQSMILQIWRRTRIEPGFDLSAVRERPVIVSVPIQPHPDVGLIADMETCAAAAFFLSRVG